LNQWGVHVAPVRVFGCSIASPRPAATGERAAWMGAQTTPKMGCTGAGAREGGGGGRDGGRRAIGAARNTPGGTGRGGGASLSVPIPWGPLGVGDVPSGVERVACGPGHHRPRHRPPPPENQMLRRDRSSSNRLKITHRHHPALQKKHSENEGSKVIGNPGYPRAGVAPSSLSVKICCVGRFAINPHNRLATPAPGSRLCGRLCHMGLPHPQRRPWSRSNSQIQYPCRRVRVPPLCGGRGAPPPAGLRGRGAGREPRGRRAAPSGPWPGGGGCGTPP